MYAIHAIDHDLWQITLPAPQFHPILPAAHPINVYLLLGKAPTLLHTGHPVQHIALSRALHQIGCPPERIERVITTGWSMHLMGNIQSFPGAELYLYSPTMVEPRDYAIQAQRERDEWESVVHELLEHHGYDAITTREEMDHFFEEYFPPVRSKLDFTPVREGHTIRAGRRALQVLHTPGPQPHHISLWEPDTKELFSGEVTLEGLPYRMHEVHSYLESQDRLIALGAESLFPNYDQPTFGASRVTQKLRRGQRFLNNFLMNATSALHGAPDLITFSEQDLGYKPSQVPRFALTLLAHRTFFEELVRSRGITAAGDGLTRRYGVDLEPAPSHKAIRHSPSLMPLGPDDL